MEDKCPMQADLDNSSAMNDSTASGGPSVSSSGSQKVPPKPSPAEKNPDTDAEVIALSPKTLLGTKTFICEICSKGFRRYSNLQLHRRGHSLPWKLQSRKEEFRKRVFYVCPEPSCVHHEPSRALDDLTGIKKHFRREHGEKKWKCDKCSKKYAVRSDWKAHMKICGIREYKCNCGTLFSRRDSFITHTDLCDALAEESGRAHAIVAPLPIVSPSASVISSVFPIRSSELPDNPNPTHILYDAPVTTDLTGGCSNTSDQVEVTSNLAEGIGEVIDSESWDCENVDLLESLKHKSNGACIRGRVVPIPFVHCSSPPEAPEVAKWVYLREINLNNNQLSELPEKPHFPSLEKLSLQKNNNLMVIPPSFFESMPILQLLDLSYTSIKSLPASISKLASLQELLLRGCELFMELPKEIEALSKLKKLDLERTEIMYLPVEILGLGLLECLRVSLYGHGNSYRESKQISKRIPAGLLAGLFKLKVVSIDVNLDDEDWVADVNDIIYELCKLGWLTTLKLYLPEAGLLKEINSVPNFKFTVGHHKQRIISCLPHEVEEEFEKHQNCLKYVNGKHIPTDIQNMLKRTNAFFLERHWTVKKLSEFGNENVVGLKFCLLVECNVLQTIIDADEFCIEGDHKCGSGVEKKPVLESLEYLGIHCMMNLRSICEGPIGKGTLSKLKSLALHDCPNLSTIFTLSLLGNLYNLEELVVEDCPTINSLVSQESFSSGSTHFLPSLKKVSLLDLPELVSISSGLSIAPKLERIIIYACPMLESLSPMELSSDDLEVIKGEIEWWDSLKWDEAEWSTIQKDHVASIFVKLKRDASLMDQLAESGNSRY